MEAEKRQLITPEIVKLALNLLLVSPARASRRAESFSINGWKLFQAAQAGAVGAVAAAPGAVVFGSHIPLIAFDVYCLLHKMAYCCWGIGSIRKCDLEQEDFPIILGIYTGVITEAALAASVGAGVIYAGQTAINIGLPTFIAKAAGVGAGEATRALGMKMGGKVIGKAIAASAPLVELVSGKLAEKFAVKIGAKLAVKSFFKSVTSSVAGFVPFIGSVVAGGVNIYFVVSIADAADTYYERKAAASVRKKLS